MRKFLSFAVFALFISLSLVSCGGDDEDEEEKKPQTVTPAPSSPSYSYANSGGFLAAINTITVTPSQNMGGFVIPATEVPFLTASAGFWAAPGSTLLAAGNVNFASQALTKSENNAYYYTPTGISGLSEDDEKVWSVAGEGTVPPISFTNTKNYPKVSGFSEIDKTVTKGQDYTISWGTNTGFPDSIYVGIVSYQGQSIYKTVGASANSCTFSKDELATLEGTQVMIQVTPYNYTVQAFSGKDYYFINQTTYTEMNGEIK